MFHFSCSAGHLRKLEEMLQPASIFFSVALELLNDIFAMPKTENNNDAYVKKGKTTCMTACIHWLVRCARSSTPPLHVYML